MTRDLLTAIRRIVRRGPLAAVLLLAATPRAPRPELYGALVEETRTAAT